MRPLAQSLFVKIPAESLSIKVPTPRLVEVRSDVSAGKAATVPIMAVTRTRLSFIVEELVVRFESLVRTQMMLEPVC